MSVENRNLSVFYYVNASISLNFNGKNTRLYSTFVYGENISYQERIDDIENIPNNENNDSLPVFDAAIFVIFAVIAGIIIVL